MKWYESEIEVRYADTDQMGVVHHSVYACYCEIGRTELCASIGLPYHELEAKGVFLMVAAMDFRFKRPARYGQPLQVRTAISRLNRRILEFQYELLDRHSRQVLCTGSTTHLFTMGVGPPLRLNDELFEILSRGTSMQEFT